MLLSSTKGEENIGWVPKFATGLIYQIRHSSKIISGQNNSLVTHILFELCPIWYINPVANFGTHPLGSNQKATKIQKHFYSCKMNRKGIFGLPFQLIF